MSYYSVGEGGLVLSRPLVWSEYGGSRFALYSPEGYSSESQTALFLRGRWGLATHIEWRFADQSRKYDVLSELTEFVDLLRPLDVTVTGWLIRSGENSGDVERYTIVGSAVLTEHAVLRWPDGSTV